VFIKKVRELMERFGFRNKEVIIEEEDPSSIQLTTQMSNHKPANYSVAQQFKIA
jgi:uncharacterized protein YajQ (UPF0234 family)